MQSVSKTVSLAFALSIASLVSLPVRADAGISAQQKCQSTIGKAAAKFVQSISKARQKCQDALLNGKVFSCPDSKESTALQSAQDKAVATICKACGGIDKACGGAPDQTPGDIAWPAICPGFEGQCTATINNLGDILTCLDCINSKAANQLIDVTFGSFQPAGTNKALLKCERTIGKNVFKFFQTKSKSLQKCWDGRIKGKHSNDCPTPGDGKAGPKIAAAVVKMKSAVCKACGGGDKACGGGDDIDPAAIGITSCPALGQCGAIAISSLQDLNDCLECVAEFKIDCVDELQTPQFQAYDPLCAGIVCGDGLISPPIETCDGSNAPGCTQTCRGPGVDECTCCGDGVIQGSSGETCDGEPGCRADCTKCGDGVLDSGEDCDDGNNIDGDCCSSTCQFEVVGSGCGDDGNGCTNDVCDGAGTCTHPNNTDPCDDGVFCNGPDTCSGGACSVHAGDPCAGGAECNVTCNEGTDDCFDPTSTACTNDGNVCTDDHCDGAGACVHPNNTASCDDGVFCNGADTCSGGSCSAHAGDPCAGGPECNGTCNETTQNCFDPGGTACTDDGNECTNDQCDGSGSCLHPNKSNGTPCTDDGNICTNDQCDGAGACAHPNNTAPCDDGLFCNGADTCSGGGCNTHAGDPCPGTECNTCQEASDTCFDPAGTACSDEGNECTDDQCDGAGQCAHPNKPDGTGCTDDGLFCTGVETCQSGACTSSGDPCPGTQCNTCQEATDSCFDPSGTLCDDGDICTSNDQCDGAGLCAGGTSCGNGSLETICGEACDPPGSAACPGQPGEAPTFCDSNCQCPCPTEVSFEGSSATNALDTGFSGQSHDAKVVGDGILTVTIGNCSSSVRPCGQCDITGGPIPNHEKSNNRRCSNNTSVICTSDAACFQQCLGGTSDGAACTVASDCPNGTCEAAGTCAFFFGSNLPLSAGAVPACVTNQVNGTITGTVNVEAGSSDNTTRLVSRVFNGIIAEQPCPICVGDVTPFDGIRDGTCSTNGGARPGLSCDVDGRHPFFGNTSFDCPPASGANIGNLDILLNASTGTTVKTLTSASPKCTAPGFGSLKCMCDTCSTAAAEPCFTDADCPSGSTCGGKRCISGSNNGAPCTSPLDCPGSFFCGRPGEATKPNLCTGGATDCAFNPSDTDTIDEGTCLSGPFDSLCTIETFRGCNADSDCPASGDTCGGKFRECYTTDGTVSGDNDVKVAGSPDPPVNDVSNPTLATLFCISPTTSSAINSVSGLPGLGRLQLSGTAKGF